jgi:arabinose-5-phosphate isomerase
MSREAAAAATRWTAFEQLREARHIIQTESRALATVARRLDESFCRAVQCVFQCRGNVIVSGIGKAGLIAQKITATLASTGTRAHYLHPAEAVHGDLGRVHADDLVLVLSQSGETAEVNRLLPSLTALGVTIVSLTARAESTLGRASTVTIELGTLEEAGALGLAPTTSAAAMLAVGDALALVVSQMRDFGREDFARFHPAGNLGLRLSKVEDLMRPLEQCRLASQSQSVRQVLVAGRVAGRRTGATMLIDGEGRLSGIFTDSDLARLFELRRDGELDAPVAGVMTPEPMRVVVGALMTDAVTLLAERKISELPVVDADGRPVGLIDITDVVGLLPKEFAGGNEDDDAMPAPAGRYRVFREPDGEPAA